MDRESRGCMCARHTNTGQAQPCSPAAVVISFNMKSSSSGGGPRRGVDSQGALTVESIGSRSIFDLPRGTPCRSESGISADGPSARALKKGHCTHASQAGDGDIPVKAGAPKRSQRDLERHGKMNALSSSLRMHMLRSWKPPSKKRLA